MLKVFLAALAAGLSLFSPAAAWSQAANACDLNQDGVVTPSDVKLATDMALGLVTPCTANVAGPGVCNVVVVQRVTNAVLTGTCLTGSIHSVSLTWIASTSSNVTSYNVYRGTTSGGPYTKLTSVPGTVTSYTDNAVQSGLTYYYVATAVDKDNNESAYSSPPAQATVSSP